MRGTRRRQGTGPYAICLSGLAVDNAASSAAVMRGCWRGSSLKYRHHTTAQKAEKIPSATNEKRHENQVIRKATIGAAAPAPRRPAEWVIPTAFPRDASDVQFDKARLAAGKVAPSPLPSANRTANSEPRPVTAPVTIVVIDQARPETVSVRRAPKRSANQPPTS